MKAHDYDSPWCFFFSFLFFFGRGRGGVLIRKHPCGQKWQQKAGEEMDDELKGSQEKLDQHSRILV